MATSSLINLSGLRDDAKCFAFVRQQRWPDGVRCPGGASDAVIRDGCDDTRPCRRCYPCKACGGRFDDLTGTGLLQRGSQIVLHMLASVQQKTIKPIIAAAIVPGSLVHTDEYAIYARLETWRYRQKTECHSRCVRHGPADRVHRYNAAAP